MARYHCPADRFTLNLSSDLRFRSYRVNWFLKGPPTDSVSKIDQVNSPANVFVFVDEKQDAIADGVFGIYRNPSTAWVNIPTARHNRSGTLSFADGHCQRLKWKAPEPKLIIGEQPVSGSQDLEALRTLQNLLP